MNQLARPDEYARSDPRFDQIRLVDGLSRDAFLNREKIFEELALRRELGLASDGVGEPRAEIERYLKALESGYPQIFTLGRSCSTNAPVEHRS